MLTSIPDSFFAQTGGNLLIYLLSQITPHHTEATCCNNIAKRS
jgi:hypothetical protein